MWTTHSIVQKRAFAIYFIKLEQFHVEVTTFLPTYQDTQQVIYEQLLVFLPEFGQGADRGGKGCSNDFNSSGNLLLRLLLADEREAQDVSTHIY